jgi:SpoVK/Ycf46/Vps4 family AAA+-type ATPase
MQFASPIVPLVQRSEPVATRQDLVLGKQQLRVMDRIALQWRARTQDPAGWSTAVPQSRSISALFAGPGGTGKSMAAEILANESRLGFYSIDLSRVVGRCIGETEKNLDAVLQSTQDSAALLFFDEADALFARRSEVRDSRDRFAVTDADLLLRRIDDCRGIVILAAPSKENIDPAFLCRLGYVVEFPLPDLAQRAEIWRRIFPPDTPVEGLNPECLARLPLSGANIRDIARASATIAAREGQPVRLSHLLRAAESECAKIDRSIDPAVITRP